MFDAATGKSMRSYSRFTVIAVVLLLAVAGAILILDRRQLSALRQTSDWGSLIWALSFTAVSYIAGAASFVLLMRVFKVRLKTRHLHNMGLVSLCMCNLVGAPTDVSLRLLFLGRHGVNNSEVVSASFLMQYFKNLCYYSLVTASILWVALVHPLPAFGSATLILIVCLLVMLLVVATSIAFSIRLRRVVLRAVGKLWRLVTRRDIGVHLERFNNTLGLGTASLLRDRRLLLPLAATTGTEIAGIILAMWFCFKALGIQVEPWVLLTGFNFGVTLALFGFIPGRMGVQEASVAGILALFGIPFSQGVIAALVFRVVYYFIPFVATLPVYWMLLREKVDLAKEPLQGSVSL